MKRAVIYARVSTDEQAEKGYSLPTQIEACRKYAGEHGLDLIAEVTDDYSGSVLDRPGLDQVRSRIAGQAVDAVIAFSSDRWTRNLAHSLILREELADAGVELHYVNRGKSEATPEGRMVENIEGVFAEYWREKIVESCKRGKLGKAKSGRWVGNTIPKYGYSREGEKRSAVLAIDEEQARIVIKIFTWYVLGDGDGKPLTVYAICEKLDKMGVRPPGGGRGPGKRWYPGTVNPMLKNRIYIGEWTYRSLGEVVTVQVPAIIEPWLFQAAQERLELNKRMNPRRTRREYLMRGRMTCTCGRALVGVMVGGKKKPNYRLYRCSSVGNWQGWPCHAGSVRADYIEERAWNWIAGMLRDPEIRLQGLREMQQEAQQQSEPLERRLATVDRLLAACEEDAADLVDELLKVRRSGEDTPSKNNGGGVLRRAIEAKAQEIESRKKTLQEERRKLAERLSAVVISDAEIERVDSLFHELGKQILADYDAGLEGATYEDKLAIFDMLRVRGERVDVNGSRAVLLSCRKPGESQMVHLGIYDKNNIY